MKVRDLGAVRCGIVTFTIDGRDAHEIRSALASRRVNVEVSEAVDTRLDFEAGSCHR